MLVLVLNPVLFTRSSVNDSTIDFQVATTAFTEMYSV